MSYVVLKCGSAVRGDTNEQSDVDFVCVHTERGVPVNTLKGRYPQISFLSLESIRHMKKKGSLFLAHLDVDGSVIEGTESLLSVIDGFRPHQSALKTAVNATREFTVGIQWFPASPLGALWLHDVLFVSFRNILYCTNALHAIYRFALHDAMSSYGFTPEQMRTMYRIRQGKYAFRSTIRTAVGAEESDMQSLSSLATTLSQGAVSFQKGGRTEWTRTWKYDYWDERLVERAIINREIADRGYRDLLKEHNYNRRILPHVVRKYVTGAQQPFQHTPKGARTRPAGLQA